MTAIHFIMRDPKFSRRQYIFLAPLLCSIEVFASTFASSSSFAAESAIPRRLEAYPPEVKAKLDARTKAMQNSYSSHIAGHTFFYFVVATSKWTPGQRVTVAFRGGNSSLYLDIANTVSEWTARGNIFFDFGTTTNNGTFRQWTTNDTTYSADVRVAFDKDGYWSFIGTDSTNSAVKATPSDTSLSLAGFDVQKPNDWKSVVLHEFGHALGFMHEHQSPNGGCETEFRWEDDPGYQYYTNQYGVADIDPNDPGGKRPGIYTVLKSPFYHWTTDMIDSNLRQIPPSRAYDVGPFDIHSIMMYSFPDWMYVRGTNSACFTAENLNLSAGDKIGIARLYPRASSKVKQLLSEQRNMLQEYLGQASLPPNVRTQYEQKLNALNGK